MLTRLLILMSVAFCFYASGVKAVVLKPTEIKPKVLVEVTDSKGVIYEFRETYELAKTGIWYTYDFGSKRKGYEVIYKGRTFTDSENCPHSEYAKKRIDAKEALLKHEVFTRDLNFDGINDIDLSLAMEDCKTGTISFFEKLILSTDNGFIVKHISQKE